MMAKRILVIDDEEGVRMSFVYSLEDTPYAVDTAASGEEGIQMAGITPYDLVFLDLKMPGMNGVETLMELRKTYQDVPIYIITAFHLEFLDQLKQAQKKGIEFELAKKPIGSSDIVHIVRSVLEGPLYQSTAK